MKKRVLVTLLLAALMLLCLSGSALAAVGNESFQSNLEKYPGLWDETKDVTQPVFQAGEDDAIRESVYVEVPCDTDGDGQRDLVRIWIWRPQESAEAGIKVPVLLEQSPYTTGDMEPDTEYKNEQGQTVMHYQLLPYEVKQQVNKSTEHAQYLADVASGKLRAADWPWDDKAHTELGVPAARTPQNATPSLTGGDPEPWHGASWTGEATLAIYKYFIPRGYAVIWGSSIGNQFSEGFTNCGGVEETLAAVAIIQWLNGNCRAYADPQGTIEVDATNWCNGNVAMTGASYDGTLPIATACTGVEGLKAIIPVAAISSWYDYYRDNGAVVAPGGYQGEDAENLALFCMSRSKAPGYLTQWKAKFEKHVEQMLADEDRTSGDYNSFWDERNYLATADRITAGVWLHHGLADFNVKTKQFDQLYRAMQAKSDAPIKLLIHPGDHMGFYEFLLDEHGSVLNYMHKWLDYYLYGIENNVLAELPEVLLFNQANWQWEAYESWPLSHDEYQKLYLVPGADGKAGTLSYEAPTPATASFKDDKKYRGEDEMEDWQEHFLNVANIEAPSDLRLAYLTEPLNQDVRINGPVKITLNITPDAGTGSLSAMLVDIGTTTRAYDIDDQVSTEPAAFGVPAFNYAKLIPNQETSPYKVITQGHVDIQNPNPSGKLYMDAADTNYIPDYFYRTVEIEPNKPYSYTFTMDATDWTFKKGMQLAVIVYSTDVNYTLLPEEPTGMTLNLGESSYIELPIVKNAYSKTTVSDRLYGGEAPTEPATPLNFSDVPQSHWAHGFITSLAGKGYVTGQTATTFAPAEPISRADFVLILARMSGDTLPAYANNFHDVAAEAYYAQAVTWAAENGITTGTAEGAFLPGNRIKRQEIAAMLVRYAEYQTLTFPQNQAAVSFTDAAEISGYAQAAVSTMQQAGIISGYPDNRFGPNDNATRAEAAKMLALLLELE